jgi:hypothetical protein
VCAPDSRPREARGAKITTSLVSGRMGRIRRSTWVFVDRSIARSRMWAPVPLVPLTGHLGVGLDELGRIARLGWQFAAKRRSTAIPLATGLLPGGCCNGGHQIGPPPRGARRGLSFAGWRCARSLAGRASSSRYHRPVLRIWVAVLDITDEVAHKLNQQHSLTTHEVRDAVQCRQGLSVRRKWDPQRGLRWYVEVRIATSNT